MTPDYPGPLRLFVAVELPGEVKRSLDGAIDLLTRGGDTSALRWVRPDGIHVTLKFLGATARDRVSAIQHALEPAVRSVSPFTLQPRSIGSFGGRRNLRVVWIGIEGDVNALAGLAGRVEKALAPLGVPAEQRAFAAHLTLARVRADAAPADRERLHDLLRGSAPPDIPAFRVERVSLMQSTLQRGGAVYAALAAFPLGDAGGPAA